MRNIVIGVTLLAAFVYFTLIVRTDTLTNFDYNSTVKIQDKIPTNFDMVLSFFSLFGSVEILSLILFIILLTRKKLISFMVLILFFVAHIIEVLGKSLLSHTGPPFQFFRYDLPFLFPSSYVQPGSSYPSGHSLRIVFTALIALFIVSQSRKTTTAMKWFFNSVVIIITLIMLITRVSLGEHWSTDVIGGTLLGASFAFISFLFL